MDVPQNGKVVEISALRRLGRPELPVTVHEDGNKDTDDAIGLSSVTGTLKQILSFIRPISQR